MAQQASPTSARSNVIDEQAGDCPSFVGKFGFGGHERKPLESHAIYDEINRVGGLVYADEGIGYHVVTDRRDVTAIAMNPAVWSSRYNFDMFVGGIDSPYPMKPLQVDAPEHRVWRALLAEPFSPNVVRGWESKTRDRANALIDTFIDAGRCDFVTSFGQVFPTTIFLDFMGLPLSDLAQFMHWEMAILHPGADGTYMGMTPVEAQGAVSAYFADVIGERRARGVVKDAPDLITAALSWEMDGAPITDENLLSFFLLMFAAGLDTVTAELAYGMLHLATHESDRARIVSDPSVIPAAVEELLRVYPIANSQRVALAETEIKDHRFKRGDYVVLGYAGVGRNEGSHDGATKVDFDRERLPQTTFGIGPHRCVGAHLARLELRVAYEEWHRRIPNYWVPEGSAFTEGANLTLGLNSLPLEWEPARGR